MMVPNWLPFGNKFYHFTTDHWNCHIDDDCILPPKKCVNGVCELPKKDNGGNENL